MQMDAKQLSPQETSLLAPRIFEKTRHSNKKSIKQIRKIKKTFNAHVFDEDSIDNKDSNEQSLANSISSK